MNEPCLGLGICGRGGSGGRDGGEEEKEMEEEGTVTLLQFVTVP